MTVDVPFDDDGEPAPYMPAFGPAYDFNPPGPLPPPAGPVRHKDGTVHFSNLKAMHLSPLHYQASCTTPFKAAASMRVGSCTHAIVLGQRPAFPVVRFHGKDRKHPDWRSFEARHLAANENTTIVTPSEWDRAEAIATAVLSDPVAMRYLDGARKEVPLEWEMAGMKCSTGGVDFINLGFCGDLKTSRTVQPDPFMRICERMHYHAQGAWVEDGCKLNGIDVSKGVIIIGVENTLPHAVTVLRLSPATLALGRKLNALWLERLRACEAANFWPGYCQTEVDFDLDAGTWDIEDEAEEEHAA